MRRNFVKVSGFSLIELLVVISIIGILAGIALVSFTGAQRQARDSERKSDIQQYQAYLETYANGRAGFYPIYTTSTSLVSVCNTDLDAQTCPEDQATGQTYRYISNTQGTKYAVWGTLESSGQYWTGCSNGRIGQVAAQSTNGDCPVADITSTPTTAVPTMTPIPPSPTPTSFPCSDGILDNGCFEAGTSPWSIPGGASIVTTQFHTGANSLQIAQPSTGFIQVRQIPVAVAGQNYIISGWIKTSLTSGNAHLVVFWRNASGAPIWTTYVATVTGTTNWTQYTTSFTPPAGTVSAYYQVDVYSGPGGNAWFDDLVLQ